MLMLMLVNLADHPDPLRISKKVNYWVDPQTWACTHIKHRDHCTSAKSSKHNIKLLVVVLVWDLLQNFGSRYMLILNFFFQNLNSKFTAWSSDLDAKALPGRISFLTHWNGLQNIRNSSNFQNSISVAFVSCNGCQLQHNKQQKASVVTLKKSCMSRGS